VIDQYTKKIPGSDYAKLGLILKCAIKGNSEKAFLEMTPDFQENIQRDLIDTQWVASIFSLMNEKDEALKWLENAIDKGFINYPFLNEYDSFLENIRGEERFKKLMERVKYEWENFEVE